MQADELRSLLEKLKRADADPEDREVQSAVNSLSGEQRKKLDSVLSSPEKMRQLLQSDTAKELLKKLRKKDV